MFGTRTKKYIFGCLVCIGGLFFLALIIWMLYCEKEKKPSPIHEQIRKYMNGEIESFNPDEYEENSAEYLLLEGIELLDKEEYAKAHEVFLEAKNLSSEDPATAIFVRYFYSQAIRAISGVGDLSSVHEMMKLVGNYPPLRGNADFLWNALINASDNFDSDLEVLEILEEYYEQNENNLKHDEIILLKNDIAQMRYYTEDYAVALRDFYEVIHLIEKENETEEMLVEKLNALSFLGDINFNFRDYSSAISFYRQCREIVLADPEDDAVLKYVAYANLPLSYFFMGDYEAARQALEDMEEIRPYLDENTWNGMEITAYDLLAQMNIVQNKLKEAEENIQKCEKLLSESKADTFFGIRTRIAFTRARLMEKKGNRYEAIRILEEMKKGDNQRGRDILGFEYNELLIRLYSNTGQYEKAVNLSQEFIAANDEQVRGLEESYLDLGRFYARTDKLEEEKSNLIITRNRVVVVCIIGFVLLILIAFLYISVKKANVTDQLTGLYNRKMLTRIIRKYRRMKITEPLGVLMIDVDFFKNYNDVYGHIKGDEVLVKVAEVLRLSLRNGDVVIRYGGEEFLVILENIERVVARDICKRIEEGMKRAAIRHEASEAEDYVTVSMGLCYKQSKSSSDILQLITKSDEALYHSKKSGRNKMTEYII